MRRVEFGRDARARLLSSSSSRGTRAPERIMSVCCFLAILITLLHARSSSGLIEECGGYRWSPRGGAVASRDSMSEDRNMASRSLLVSLCLGVPASVATGAELLVPEQFASIQSAVAAAQHGDVISIAPGQYNVGDLQLPDRAISIRGRGAADATVLTGEWIQVLGGTAVRSLEQLTLRGFTGYGALHVNGAAAHIQGVVVDQNTVHGIFVNTNASLTTRDCTISGNPRGAFVYVNSFWTAEDCVFSGNGYSEAYGGAVGFHVGSGCSFTRCEFTSNSASAGGAIGLSFSGSRTFDSCLFEGNTSLNGPVWWTEFGGSGVLRNSVFCGHSVGDLQGGWIDGGGNQFFPKGCATPCSSDLVADTVVNGADMAIVLNFWGTDGSQFPGVDIDGDGIVNGADLAAVLNAWGPCPQ